MGLLITHIDIADADKLNAVYQLQRQAYQSEACLIDARDFPPLQESKESLRRSGEQFFGIKQGDELLAAISFAIYPEKIEICRLIVSPVHHRKGFGRRLVQFVLSEYAASKECIVSTASKNIPACNLYIDAGFKAVSDQSTTEGIQM